MSEAHNLSQRIMKFLEMLIDCSLAALAAFVLFPVVSQTAATAPAVVAALLGAGIVLAILKD
ncbi:MAG TPA: hypothetical protein DCP31_09070 [Cyanobacteria bacterium UBA8543]|nr:hypothetical protein [Cyanobacteria bacterium UBA8543]